MHCVSAGSNRQISTLEMLEDVEGSGFKKSDNYGSTGSKFGNTGSKFGSCVRLMKAAHQDWCAQTQKALQLG